MSDEAYLRRRLRLYGITPDGFHDEESLREAIAEAARGGLTAIQYRHKRARSAEKHESMARAVVEVASAFGLLSIINDDPALAVRVGADGVHVGAEDAKVGLIRSRFGADLIIGASPPTIESACAAVLEGANYLGIGAIFDARASKPNASDARGVGWIRQLREIAELSTVPIVAIGGVTAANCRSCLAHGADGVASIRAVFGGPSPRASTEQLLRAFQ